MVMLLVANSKLFKIKLYWNKIKFFSIFEKKRGKKFTKKFEQA